MTIDRAKLRAIRADIDLALATVGAKHGVIMTAGNATFTSTDATMKVTMSVANSAALNAVASGEAPKDVKAHTDYIDHCESHGLKPQWLGMWFTVHGKELKIVGLLPNKRKNNVLIEGKAGGRYIISPSEVLAAFKQV